MQLTKLDRWLREHFVYETHVYTLRLPETIPPGIIVEELPDTPGRRFNHRFIIRDTKKVEQLIQELKANNYMFTTRIVDRDAWYVRFIAPKGRSITWWIIWLLASAAFALTVGSTIRNVLRNPETQKNLREALKLLKE